MKMMNIVIWTLVSKEMMLQHYEMLHVLQSDSHSIYDWRRLLRGVSELANGGER